MMNLDGKVALVTGGAGGIGSGICEVLAEHGARVIVGYHSSREQAVALAGRLPNRVGRAVPAGRLPPGVTGDAASAGRMTDAAAEHAALAVPVTDSAALAALARRIDASHGRLDILVNCHGATRFVPAADLDALDDELIDRVLTTNVRGTFATVRAFRALLAREASGLVVNISSIAATLAIGSNIMYCASKAAVDTLTKSLALALAPAVRVVAVSPGLVLTEAAKKNFEQSFLDGHIARTPLKRLTTPRDIGEVVVALATHMTAVTGVVVPVDAGRSLS